MTPPRRERPRRRAAASLLVEVALFMALTVVYEWARAVVRPDSPEEALQHARDIVAAQQRLELYVEPDVQRFFENLPGGEASVAWLYTVGHTPGFICFFGWLWWRHRHRFRFVWTWFWIGHVFAVVSFWLWPLAPPRLASLGLEDLTKETLTLGGTLDWFQSLRNEFAAMPSLHVGYTLFFATVITILGTTRRRYLAWIWPVAMLVVVMATANHYWLDGVGGAAVFAAAFVVALGARRLLGGRLRGLREAHA